MRTKVKTVANTALEPVPLYTVKRSAEILQVVRQSLTPLVERGAIRTYILAEENKQTRIYYDGRDIEHLKRERDRKVLVVTPKVAKKGSYIAKKDGPTRKWPMVKIKRNTVRLFLGYQFKHALNGELVVPQDIPESVLESIEIKRDPRNNIVLKKRKVPLPHIDKV